MTPEMNTDENYPIASLERITFASAIINNQNPCKEGKERLKIGT